MIDRGLPLQLLVMPLLHMHGGNCLCAAISTTTHTHTPSQSAIQLPTQ